MDLKQIVMLALQVSILLTVFGFGLRATVDDLLYLVRRPGLFVRAILAVFVIMPIVAVLLARMFNFPTVKIALVALAISPVPPILPTKETKAGGHAAFALGLMAWLSLLSIVAVPLSLALLGWLFGRPLEEPLSAIAGVMLKGALVPLSAGMLVRAIVPDFAERLEKPVTLVAKVLLPLAVLVLVAGALPTIWELIGSGAVIAIVLFTLAGLLIGHVLGGPDPDHSVALALATASRHPAIAFTVAAANFPDVRFGGIILLYLIVSAIVCIPYIRWQQHQVVGAVRRA